MSDACQDLDAVSEPEVEEEDDLEVGPGGSDSN
jgi:hypothetical protein